MGCLTFDTAVEKRSFSSADDKMIISGNGMAPSLRKAKVWSLSPK